MADNRIAYGLAKKYGIDTTGMAPGEVWEALKEKGVKELGGHKDEVYYKSAEELKKQQEIKGPPQAYGFADKTRKNTKHHKRHAQEMGYKNQDDYERAAVEFFNSDKGKLYYSRVRDRFYRYDEKTGELAISSDGIIHTFDYRTTKEFAKIRRQEELNER